MLYSDIGLFKLIHVTQINIYPFGPMRICLFSFKEIFPCLIVTRLVVIAQSDIPVSLNIVWAAL
ncbi:hypothetical protein SHLO109777_02930 [Shewanella loihica]